MILPMFQQKQHRSWTSPKVAKEQEVGQDRVPGFPAVGPRLFIALPPSARRLQGLLKTCLEWGGLFCFFFFSPNVFHTLGQERLALSPSSSCPLIP